MILAMMVGCVYKAEKPVLVVTVAFWKTGAVGCAYLLSLAVTLWVLVGRAERLPRHPQAFGAHTLRESQLLYAVLSHHQGSGEAISAYF